MVFPALGGRGQTMTADDNTLKLSVTNLEFIKASK